MALSIPGFGYNVAADTVSIGTPPRSGEKIQFVKIDAGPIGQSAPVGPQSPLPVTISPTQTTGSTVYRSISVTTTAALVYGAGTTLSSWYLANLNANSTQYFKLYNKAIQPTLGTDTPWLTIPVPAGSAANCSFTPPIGFPLGLGIGASGGIADNDVTAVAANSMVANLMYSGSELWSQLGDIVWSSWLEKWGT